MTRLLRCSAFVSPEGRTGEGALQCGLIALSCVDCGEAAGCVEHAFFCRQCGRAVCDACAGDHTCQAETGESRAA